MEYIFYCRSGERPVIKKCWRDGEATYFEAQGNNVTGNDKPSRLDKNPG
jgi:hypothetical protein